MKIKKKIPKFLRQEWFKHKTLGKKWRRPKGRQSKLRKGEKARGKVPSLGYRSPKSVRGLTRRGYKEIRILNPAQIEKINPNKEIIVISSTIGKKKKIEIIKKAEEKGVKIANI
jgi:large subunit ribosomal protein L32e